METLKRILHCKLEVRSGRLLRKPPLKPFPMKYRPRLISKRTCSFPSPSSTPKLHNYMGFGSKPNWQICKYCVLTDASECQYFHQL